MSLFRTSTPFLQNNSWLHQSQNALRYNTSQVGSVVPLCFGTVRQQINLIALGQFMGPGGGKKGKGVGPLPIAGTNTVSGGKGGGGKGKGKKGSHDFSVDLAVALCQGPITFNPNNLVFANSSVEAFGATGAAAGKGTSGNQLNFYIGTDGQTITHPVGASSVNYSGTCVVTATPIDLGPSPAIPNLGFELNTLLYTTGGPSFPLDANPGAVVTAFLTDPRYGAGFPAANLDDLVGSGAGTTFGEYCQTFGLLISVSLDGQQKAAQWLEGLARLLNTAPVCSGELLTFKPFGDIGFEANGAIWNPNLVPVYALTDADFLPWHPHQDSADPEVGQDDPIIVTRTNPDDAFNWFPIEYLDRANFYNSTILAVYDQGAIDQYGLRIGDSLPGKCFASTGSAQVAAQLYLQRTQYIRDNYKFQIGWDKALLEPMDIVLLTGSAGDTYLSNQAVRVTSIEENDNGDLTIEGEDVVTGHSPVPTAAGSGGPPPPPSGLPAPAWVTTDLCIQASFSQITDVTQTYQSAACIIGTGPPGSQGCTPVGSGLGGYIGASGLTTGYPSVVIAFVIYAQWHPGTSPEGYIFEADPEIQQVNSPSLGNFTRRGFQEMLPDFTVPNLSDPSAPYSVLVKQEMWWAPAPTALTNEIVAVTVSSHVRAFTMITGALVGFSPTGVMNPWDTNATISNANWSKDAAVISVNHLYTANDNDVPIAFSAVIEGVPGASYPAGPIYLDGFTYVNPFPPPPFFGGLANFYLVDGIDGAAFGGIPPFGSLPPYGLAIEITTPMGFGGSVPQPRQINQTVGNQFRVRGLQYPWPLWVIMADALHLS